MCISVPPAWNIYIYTVCMLGALGGHTEDTLLCKVIIPCLEDTLCAKLLYHGQETHYVQGKQL